MKRFYTNLSKKIEKMIDELNLNKVYQKRLEIDQTIL